MRKGTLQSNLNLCKTIPEHVTVEQSTHFCAAGTDDIVHVLPLVDGEHFVAVLEPRDVLDPGQPTGNRPAERSSL